MREEEEEDATATAATVDPPAAAPTSWLQMGAAIIAMTAMARIQERRMALAHMVAIQRRGVWGTVSGANAKRQQMDRRLEL